MEVLDDLVLINITRFLEPKDIVRLGRTSRRMHSLMPRLVFSNEKWTGEDFRIYGTKGRCCPELYFDRPELPGGVTMSLSVTWQDQGWGNRNGELFMKLMRPVGTEQPLEVAEHQELFGIAEHYKKHHRL